MKKKSGGQTLAAIESEIARLKAEAEKLRRDEVAGVIERIVVAIKHYGITAEQLGFSGRDGKGRAPAPIAGKVAQASTVGVAKYQDPETGKTWTGHGKPPAWIAGAPDRSKFEISGSRLTSAPKAKPGPKNAGVPKYRDPATGKTWTGNGKPPAWIAGAADRSAFLIESAVTASA